MVPQRIERAIVIDAPLEVVWAVVTEPEHISRWFSDSAELDLRPGGAALLRWHESGNRIEGRVERVEPPHLFSFRWRHGPGADIADGNSTLVEFRLAPEGDATRLTVTESGFGDVARPDEDAQRLYDDHRRGWQQELGELAEYIRGR